MSPVAVAEGERRSSRLGRSVATARTHPTRLLDEQLMEDPVAEGPLFASLPPGAIGVLRRVAVVLGGVSLGISLTVLAGWVLGDPILRSFAHGHVAMKANTAIAVSVASIGVVVLSLGSGRPAVGRLVRIFSLVVAVIALATLFEWITGFGIGIDQLLFKESAGAVATPHPGRIAPNTAVALFLIAGALELSASERRELLRQWFAIVVAGISLVALLGYASEVPSLAGLASSAQMALPTAVALLALGVGILATQPDAGVMLYLTRGSPGARLTRWLVPAVIVIPTSLAVLRFTGTRSGLFGAAVGSWLVQLLTIALFCGVIALYAKALDGAEQQRRLQELLSRSTEQRFRELLSVANEGVWIIDAQARTTFVNETLASMLGLIPEEMLGRRFTDLVDEEAAKELSARLGKRAHGHGEAYELRLRGADGGMIWTLVSATPLYAADGSDSGSLSMLTDITERKQTELELRRLAQIVDSSADAILSKDRECRLTSWNRGAEHMYGYSAAEIIGRHASVLVPAKLAGEDQAILARALGGEQIDYYETQRIAKDGSLIDVSLSVSPILGPDDEIVGASSIAREITEQVRARDALRTSEELFRGGFEHSPIGMALTSPDGTLRRVNAAFAEMLGYDDPQQLAGVAFASITHPDDVAHDQEGVRMMLEQGKPYTTEKRYLRRDGEVVIVILGSTVVSDRDGQPVALFTQVEDITDRKRAEGELAYMKGLLDRTQEISRTGGWEYEVATGRLTWTDEVYRIYGVEPTSDPASVASAVAAYDPEDAPVIEAAFERLVTVGEPYDLELRLIGADGRRIWVRTSSRPVIEDGRVIRVGGNIVDVTDRRQAEEEIRTLNAELEQRVAARTAELQAANQELEAFAYSLAHDLRSPLRAIAGFGAALARHHGTALGDDGGEMLGRMRTASVKMGELIDAMLLLSELTRRELSPTRVDLSTIAREISEELRSRDRSREVEVVIEDGLAAVADPQLVRVLLRDLLENAWKFTQRCGHARIDVARADPGVIAVRDNGAGFEMAYSDLLFKPFARLHDADEFPGTGIGLTTVQRIVRRHGGAVWGEGKPDAGASFYFKLEPEKETES